MPVSCGVLRLRACKAQDAGAAGCLRGLIGISRLTEICAGKVVACNPPFIQATYAMAAEAAAQVVPVAAALHIVVTRQHLGQFGSRDEMCHLYDCSAMLWSP